MGSGQVLVFRPFVLLAAIVVILLLMRWAFSPGGGIVPRKRLQIGPADYGLLVPAAVVATAEEGEAVRETLAGHGIRATVVRNDEGALEVRVFEADTVRAREVLG